MKAPDLDSPARIESLRRSISGNPALRSFYQDVYRRYANCLARCPAGGVALELGSGGGFSKDVIPEIVTSDLIPYEGIDLVADARRLPFPDGGVRGIFMLNVLHHIPDVSAFFSEATRCLVPGGRVLILDHHWGWFSRILLRYLHHEAYSPAAPEWRFDSQGPLSGANTALAWIVFARDRSRFEKESPSLSLVKMTPFSPFLYWLAGGVSRPSVVPPWAWAIRAANSLDRLTLAALGQSAASWIEIELLRS